MILSEEMCISGFVWIDIRVNGGTAEIETQIGPSWNRWVRFKAPDGISITKSGQV